MKFFKKNEDTVKDTVASKDETGKSKMLELFDKVCALRNESGNLYLVDNYGNYYRYSDFEYSTSIGWGGKEGFCFAYAFLTDKGEIIEDGTRSVTSEYYFDEYFVNNWQRVDENEFMTVKEEYYNEYMGDFNALDIKQPWYYFGKYPNDKNDSDELYIIRIDAKYSVGGKNYIAYSSADYVHSPNKYVVRPTLEWNSFKGWYTVNLPENFEMNK